MASSHPFSNILKNLGGPIIKMKKLLLTVVLGLLSLPSVVPQGYRNQNLILSASSPDSCQSIINQSRFSGTCCALNSTIDGFCLLTVINGECKVCYVQSVNSCEKESDLNSVLHAKYVHNISLISVFSFFLYRLLAESGR